MEGYQSRAQIENKESPETFLNSWDKKYLEKGAVGMLQKMYKEFNNNFPEVILLPERGARPLYYLLQPLFKKLNLKKGTKVPKVIFFSVSKRPGVVLAIAEENSEITTDNDFEEKLIEIFPFLPEEEIQKVVKSERLGDMITSRKNMRLRAQEIEKQILENNSTVAIIDEMLAIGATTNEIKRAFNNYEIPAYTLVALNDNVSEKSGYVFDEEEDERNPKSKRYSFSFEQLEDAIGVNKSINDKYSIPIVKDSLDEGQKLAQVKRQLREEMKKLGEDIAKKI